MDLLFKLIGGILAAAIFYFGVTSIVVPIFMGIGTHAAQDSIERTKKIQHDMMAKNSPTSSINAGAQANAAQNTQSHEQLLAASQALHRAEVLNEATRRTQMQNSAQTLFNSPLRSLQYYSVNGQTYQCGEFRRIENNMENWHRFVSGFAGVLGMDTQPGFQDNVWRKYCR